MNHRIEQSTYTTDQPVAVNPFAEMHRQAHLSDSTLDPRSFDGLPLGKTTFLRREATNPPRAVDVRRIEIVKTAFGKAITGESYPKNISWAFESTPDLSELMDSLGYLTKEDEITAIPTPQSVALAAKQHDVHLRFFEQHGTIPGREYLQTFADGMYPVSLRREYEHDISDDHLTAVVLGGEPIREVLAEIGSKYAVADEPAMKMATKKVDELTSELRVHVAHHPILDDLFPRKQKDFPRTIGYFGISATRIAHVIGHTRKTAESFGIKLRT